MCGALNVTYPFWIGGVQPPLHCGFPAAFRLTCDAEAGRAYLTRTSSGHLYRVEGIYYNNNSLAVAVETTFAGDGTCDIPGFNVFSSLAFNISDTNENLVFVYDCAVPPSMQLPRPCANRTVGAYVSGRWGGESHPPQWVPKNCSSMSLPVRGFGGIEPTQDYGRLIGSRHRLPLGVATESRLRCLHGARWGPDSVDYIRPVRPAEVETQVPRRQVHVPRQHGLQGRQASNGAVAQTFIVSSGV